MTERRPPSLGTYRPQADDVHTDRRPKTSASQRPPQAPEPASQEFNQPQRPAPPPPGADDHLPRIITTRVRNDAQESTPARDRTGRRRPPPPPRRDGISGLRIVTYTLLGVVAFVAAGAAAAFVFLPTEAIRARVAAEVKARTGRDLIIAGRPGVTLWPRPSISLQDVTLSAPAAMGGAPLIKAAEIEVAVNLLPLLLHDVTIDRLILRKPVIDLTIDAQGRRSWDFADASVAPSPVRLAQANPQNLPQTLPKELQDFVKGSTDTPQPGERPLASSLPPGRARISDVTLANVGIVDGTVHYRDVRSAVDETISGLNATLSLANIASPLEVKGTLVWRQEPVAVTAQLSPFRALIDGRPVQAQIKADGALLSFTFDGAAAPGTDFDIDGRVTARSNDVDRLTRWAMKTPQAAFTGVLSLDGKLKQSAQLTALTDARLSLGPTTATGTLSLDTHGARPYLKGALQLAGLDLATLRLLADAGAVVPATPQAPQTPAAPQSIEDLLKNTTETPAATQPAKPPKPQVRGYTRRDGWSDEPLDLAMLGLADADVRLGFDKVVWTDLATGPGQITLALKAKQAKITLDDVQLYGGRARGIITVDGAAAEPTIGSNFIAEGVSALPMLKALSDFDWISGRARIAVAVAGRGTTERQLIATLNGKADMAVTDGALLGFNFGGLLKGLGQGRIPTLDRQPNEKTDFSEFAASAVIANGIVRNDDLRLKSPQLTATGSGTVDLPARTMDYVLKPKLQPGLEVPLKLTGSLDKPTVTPDVGGLIRDPGAAVQAVQDLAKTPAGREVQDTVKGLLNGDPNARAKAKGFLDQLLKN